MNISQVLNRETMVLDMKAQTKEEAIDELIDVLDQAGKLHDRLAFKKTVWQREKESSTGIGEGVAIPHGKSNAVKTPAIAFGRSREGIDFASLDGEPAHLFFLIAAKDAHVSHLETLSQLSTYLMDQDFRGELLAARTKKDVEQAIQKKEEGEEARSASEEKEKTAETDLTAKENRKRLVAVTACPTGIAHTYMAADALVQKAKERGIAIKVQKNGSAGVKDALTPEEIEQADAVIIAADASVDLSPFAGKKLITASVTDGIRRPGELIEQALGADAPIYKDDHAAQEAIRRKKEERKAKQPAFYKHLMNGVSYMLPFVVGGGILIALSFAFGIHAANPDSESYNPFAEALSVIGGGSAFALMIPIFAGFIAYSIADRPGFAPGAVGGMMAAQGGAGFLGGLIAGFLAGYLVNGLKKLFSRLPEQFEGLKPVLLYPLFGILLTGLIMFFLINDPVQALNTAVKNWLRGMGQINAVLLGMILGGMMAVDMGGPINKAAYTTGIALISAGIYAPQAAIMAGGMVPPLGMALATTFSKKKFTRQEREAGKTAYIMGASFITEGAIPFAAQDPFRVIPASVAGAAVAGALSMAFDCALRAPHGGIFVILFVDHALLYLLAIFLGAIVTAALTIGLKKPVR